MSRIFATYGSRWNEPDTRLNVYTYSRRFINARQLPFLHRQRDYNKEILMGSRLSCEQESQYFQRETARIF